MEQVKTKKPTQPERLLAKLKEANGEWINGQYFLREMYFSQYHSVIFTLENEQRWKDQYEGYEIQHSDFTDEHGFKSYRLVPKAASATLF